MKPLIPIAQFTLAHSPIASSTSSISSFTLSRVVQCPRVLIIKYRAAVAQCCELQGVQIGSQQRENSDLLQFFFDKGENASQVAEIANGIYGAGTVTANYVQFSFRRFRSGIFDVKGAPRTSMPVIESVDKITEIIEVDRPVSSRSIA
ncbi:histone-lysine N-methyltransferase SETMAR [Trichonephila clavipes]|nr:histone-lysine N-methyltransferase SETMAR [Trichonephila clavipes]